MTTEMIQPTDEMNAELRRSPVGRSAKLKAYWGVPGRRAAHGELTRAAMADPAVRARISERTAAAMRDPERKARHCTRIRRTHSDPAFIEAQRARAVAQWSDPAVRREHGELTKRKVAEKVARERTKQATC